MTRSPSHRLRRGLAGLVLALLLPAMAACGTAPATGDTIFTGGMSLAEEKRLGSEQHPKILQQFGGAYDDPELTDYVASIGRLLAQTSELPQLDWTFTVLDTPIVNAFALPGGYVYVSRGLLALAENEAQLAGVMAHEIGHVTARHSAERYGSSQIAGLATVLSGVLLGRTGAQVTSGLSQVALSSYSRGQELEADTLGVRYLSRAGYDPQAMATFLAKLQANSRLEATLAGNPDAADDFSLLQTHPRTADRVQQAIRAADTKPVQDPMLARDVYLPKLAGMIYGHSPAQGFVRGQRFLHPELRFAFEVPRGFRLLNGTTQVTARGPGGSAIVFDRASGQAAGDVASYLVDTWAKGARLARVERITVNGLPGATALAQARTDAGARTVRLAAIRYDSETIYRFLFLHPQRGDLSAAFQDTLGSFRKLGAAEAAELEPYRVRLYTVQPGDSVQDLAARLPYPDHRELRFRVLNGLDDGQTLEAGRTVKLVQ